LTKSLSRGGKAIESKYFHFLSLHNTFLFAPSSTIFVANMYYY
jgi:hypothetical protein